MPQAVKVGIFAFVALVVLGWFILQVEDLELFGPEGREIFAVFDSVAGLDDRAAVRIAGVRVGTVDGVSLVDRQAKVGLSIEEPVGLTEGTYARIASLGLLGENYVEIVPGPEGAPPLPEGAVIPGESPITIDQAMEQLAQVGESIQEITGSISGGLAPGGNLTVLIEDIGATASAVRRLVEANEAQVGATVQNFEQASAALARELPRLADQMNRVLVEVQAVMAENRPELEGSMANVERLTSELQTSVDNLNLITGRLARGEGSIGKLLTSDEAHDSLVSTLNTIEGGVEELSGTLEDTLGRIQRVRLDLGAEGHWLQDAEESYGAFSLTIDPDPEANRLYRVALVDAPRGAEETTVETITVTQPDGSTETRTIETVRVDDDPTLSALFGFELERGVLWGGLIEDSFGLQVDYPVWEEQLWLRLEAFDFDRREDLSPHLRLMGRWQFHPNFYLLGGYDDFLESDRDSLFLGGGVRWNDDNLKALIGNIPSF